MTVIENARSRADLAGLARRGVLRGCCATRRRSRAASCSLLVVLAGILAPLLAPYGPAEVHFEARSSSRTVGFALGTDDLGRDVLSRMLYGIRASLMVGRDRGGPRRRRRDAARAGRRLLAVARRARLPPDRRDAGLPVPHPRGGAGRHQRAQPRGRRHLARHRAGTDHGAGGARRDDAAQGEPVRARRDRHGRVRRPDPRAAHPAQRLSAIIVQATVIMPAAVLGEAVLSFLGLGIQPPTPSLGIMLSDAQQYLCRAPTAALFPGLAIAAICLGFNLLGDALRDALDPTTWTCDCQCTLVFTPPDPPPPARPAGHASGWWAPPTGSPPRAPRPCSSGAATPSTPPSRVRSCCTSWSRT